MAHKSSKDWCVEISKRFPKYFLNTSVLEIGSLYINGSVRSIFTDCEYIGLDVIKGNCVDVVSIAHEYKPDRQFDVVCSVNSLEHDIHYKKTLTHMIDLLKQDGLMFFTSPDNTVPEHGTKRRHPGHSATSQMDDQWAQYYKALSIQDIKDTINLDEVFVEYEIYINQTDLVFWGIKR